MPPYRRKQYRRGKNKRVYKKKFYKNKNRSVKTIVRRELGRQEETKVVSLNSTASAILAQKPFTYAPLQYIATGSDDMNRIGRKIFVRHIKIKGVIQTDGFSHLEVRWLVVWLPGQKSYLIPGGGYQHLTNGVVNTDLFYSTASNQISALINNKLGAKVILDRRFQVINKVAGQVTAKHYQFDIPIMKSVQYMNATAPSLLNDMNLYLVRYVTVPGMATNTSVGCFDEHNVIVTFKDA